MDNDTMPGQAPSEDDDMDTQKKDEPKADDDSGDAGEAV